MKALIGFILLTILIILYILPGWLAEKRGHRQAGAIICLNILLGWTLIGWVAAFVWALTNSSPESDFEQARRDVRT